METAFGLYMTLGRHVMLLESAGLVLSHPDETEGRFRQPTWHNLWYTHSVISTCNKKNTVRHFIVSFQSRRCRWSPPGAYIQSQSAMDNFEWNFLVNVYAVFIHRSIIRKPCYRWEDRIMLQVTVVCTMQLPPRSRCAALLSHPSATRLYRFTILIIKF